MEEENYQNERSLQAYVGTRHGQLIIESVFECASKRKKVLFLCRCDCGNVTFVNPQFLLEGKITNCKHDWKPRQNVMAIIGQKFSRLTVEGIIPSGLIAKKSMCQCRCDCGNISFVSPYALISGHTHSCGCLDSEVLIRRNFKHGLSDTRIYGIWRDIKKRCNNPNFWAYEYYGGKGVKVCDEWSDFQSFYDWSISHGYNDTLTIDRIDNEGDYSPDNCRWVTRIENCNNKSNNRFYSLEGTSKTLPQWSRTEGVTVSASIIRDRLERGWDLESAIYMPKQPNPFLNSETNPAHKRHQMENQDDS